MTSLDDRAQIHDLYSRYCFLLDANDLDGVAGCFEPDGELVIVGLRSFHGREEIISSLAASADKRSNHYVVNLWFRTLLHDRAECAASFILWRPAGSLAARGTYDDTLAKGGDGQWRWQKKQISFIWKDPEYEFGR